MEIGCTKPAADSARMLIAEVNQQMPRTLGDSFIHVRNVDAFVETMPADSIGPRLYSGVGGQVDFVRGAARSRGGKPIIALPATVRWGEFSRIVGQLKPGAGVTTSRNDVHYVVTEHGVADLYGKTIRERARALINIAAPEFREELMRQARELHYL